LQVSRRYLIRSLAAAFAMRVAPASATRKTITGNVSFGERLTLPMGARLTVRLLDVTLGAGQAEIVAETRVPTRVRNPMPYWITFDSMRLDPTKSFVLDARVTIDDFVILNTLFPRSIHAYGADRVDLTVEAGPGAFKRPLGHWLVEEIEGIGVVDGLR
jgi:putative lipoprotein